MYLNLRTPPQKAAKKRILLQVLVPKLQALVKNANKYHNIHLKTVKWPKLSLIMALYQKTESCNLYNVGCYDLQQKEDNNEKKEIFCFTSSVSPICWPSWFFSPFLSFSLNCLRCLIILIA